MIESKGKVSPEGNMDMESHIMVRGSESMQVVSLLKKVCGAAVVIFCCIGALLGYKTYADMRDTEVANALQCELGYGPTMWRQGVSKGEEELGRLLDSNNLASCVCNVGCARVYCDCVEQGKGVTVFVDTRSWIIEKKKLIQSSDSDNNDTTHQDEGRSLVSNPYRRLNTFTNCPVTGDVRATSVQLNNIASNELDVYIEMAAYEYNSQFKWFTNQKRHSTTGTLQKNSCERLSGTFFMQSGGQIAYCVSQYGSEQTNRARVRYRLLKTWQSDASSVEMFIVTNNNAFQLSSGVSCQSVIWNGQSAQHCTTSSLSFWTAKQIHVELSNGSCATVN